MTITTKLFAMTSFRCLLACYCLTGGGGSDWSGGSDQVVEERVSTILMSSLNQNCLVPRSTLSAFLIPCRHLSAAKCNSTGLKTSKKPVVFRWLLAFSVGNKLGINRRTLQILNRLISCSILCCVGVALGIMWTSGLHIM